MVLSDGLIPEYWLPQPPMQLSESEQRACDVLLAEATAVGPQQPIAYTLTIPKWQFLCYVAEQHGLALHGSENGEIEYFEPRQPVDLTEFGAQNAVYAAADGIWPLYFAIVDRAKSQSIMNASIRIEQEDGSLSRPYYFFSISRQAQESQPYCNGFVYLLPNSTFIQQSPAQVGPLRIHVAQLASPEGMAPLAKLAVTPHDFPFLAQMRWHDHARLREYADVMIQGLPWPAESINDSTQE